MEVFVGIVIAVVVAVGLLAHEVGVYGEDISVDFYDEVFN